MRKLVLLAVLMPALASAQAQPVPSRFGYQGRLVDKSGAPLNGTHQVRFTIYKEAKEGTPLWDETQKLALTNGFYSTFLGAGKALPVGYGSTVFDGSDLYLGVAVDGTEELTSRQQIGAVVYALRTAWAVRAKDADHADEATHAATATNATNASNATNAGYATTAGSAQSATNAASASRADYAASAGTSTNVGGGGTVSARDVNAYNLRVDGAATVKGLVMGGARVYSAVMASNCEAWGDGTCSGSHPNFSLGCKSGTRRVVDTNSVLCVQ
jgi:hypothetical protein